MKLSHSQGRNRSAGQTATNLPGIIIDVSVPKVGRNPKRPRK
jgi:hypothetical protein